MERVQDVLLQVTPVFFQTTATHAQQAEEQQGDTVLQQERSAGEHAIMEPEHVHPQHAI